MVSHITVEVYPARKRYWVLAQETTRARVVVPEAVIIQICLGIGPVARVLERVAERSREVRDLAK